MLSQPPIELNQRSWKYKPVFQIISLTDSGIYILAIPISPSPGGVGEIFCSNLKTGKNLKEDLKKERIRG